MAAPDMNNPTKVEGKLARLSATTSSQTILANAAASGKLMRIVALTAENVDGTNAADITVTLNDGNSTTDYRKTIAVPADSSMVVIARDYLLYLPEGWTLAGSASASGDIVFHCSYEEIN